MTQLKDGLSLSRRVTVRPLDSAHHHLQLSGLKDWNVASPSLLRAAGEVAGSGALRGLEVKTRLSFQCLQKRQSTWEKWGQIEPLRD